ncbi:MAG: hypothetical protein F4X40_02145 [Chloroflexi bacterium]|nr:hypothetical protein [Chloroflexota bacterium]
MGDMPICCSFEADQVQWFVGAAVTLGLIIVGALLFRKLGIKPKPKIGKVRPQALLVLSGVTLIAVVALLLNHTDVTSIAVGGMIALTMRIIETDQKEDETDRDDKKIREVVDSLLDERQSSVQQSGGVESLAKQPDADDSAT